MGGSPKPCPQSSQPLDIYFDSQTSINQHPSQANVKPPDIDNMSLMFLEPLKGPQASGKDGSNDACGHRQNQHVNPTAVPKPLNRHEITTKSDLNPLSFATIGISIKFIISPNSKSHKKSPCFSDHEIPAFAIPGTTIPPLGIAGGVASTRRGPAPASYSGEAETVEAEDSDRSWAQLGDLRFRGEWHGVEPFF